MRRKSGEVHTATTQLDDEQHVQPLQPDRLHAEEIDRAHTVPVRSDKLTPCCASPCADRSETGLPKPRAHGRRRNCESQALQLADNPLIAPTRVRSGKAQNQRSYLGTQRRATGRTCVRPSLGHQAPMPLEQPGRRDHEGSPGSAGGAYQRAPFGGIGCLFWRTFTCELMRRIAFRIAVEATLAVHAHLHPSSRLVTAYAGGGHTSTVPGSTN